MSDEVKRLSLPLYRLLMVTVSPVAMEAAVRSIATREQARQG
jgi:hypothetical protein